MELGRALQLLVLPVFISGLVFSSQSVFAGDLEWQGLYRIEGYSIQNPSLASGQSRSKDYGVHHLILRPRIVAGDGLYINGQFQILNTRAAAEDFLGGPQLGAFWGDGLGGGGTDSMNSNTASRSQKEETLSVSEFYLTLAQEFGSLIVGRAPLEFGLGVSYSAGKGLFDHYYTNRDLVGYKVVMGNFFFMPMFAKISEGAPAGFDDVSETIIHLQYENPEGQVAMGVMYNTRKSGGAGNDFPASVASGIGEPFQGAATGGDMNLKTLNIFYKKSWENDRVGFEIVNQKGDYGVGGISANAFAFAVEYDHKPAAKRMQWGIRAGWASGDDPSTADEYEGYQFDQNYDVAMLLFNQSLGQANLLKSQLLGTRYGTSRGATTVNSPYQDADIEAVSNAYYFAPRATYKWRDRWDIEAVVATAWLDNADFGTGPTISADDALGYEFDLSLIFKPNDRVVWKNSLGVMMPGSAFEMAGAFNTETIYGFVSRAAISF